MDAYTLSEDMKKMWAQNAHKVSGHLDMKVFPMTVCVFTDEGYREVVGMVFNDKLGIVELVLDNK